MAVKISELTASAALTLDDFFPVVDSGSLTTKRASAEQILDYITGSTFNTLTVTVLTGSTTTGSLAKFTTISSSNTSIAGNLVLDGTASLSSYPDYAYIIYTASYDKLVVYPGLYVSGNLTGSDLGAFQTVSASTGLFTTITSSNLYMSSSGAAIIDVDSTQSALRITQRGSGESIRIEDQVNPDSSPFIVNSAGNVGIGITTPDQKVHIQKGTAGTVDSNSNTVLTLENSTSTFLHILNPNTDDGGILFGCPASSIGGGIVYNDNISSTKFLDFRAGNNTTRLTIDGNSGNIAIGKGKVSGNSRLDVLGNTIISGNLTVTGSVFVSGSSIYGQVAELTSSTSNYTLLRQDSGKFLHMSSSSAMNLTVPSGLPVGFTVSFCQNGSGQITVVASGVTIKNRQSHTKTAGDGAVASLICTGSNGFILTGDTAA